MDSDSNGKEDLHRALFDALFGALCALRSEFFLFSLDEGYGRRFRELMRDGVERENALGELLTICDRADVVQALIPDRPRLCCFIHTSRTLRELGNGGERRYGVQELLLMTEQDAGAVRGCALIEPVVLKELASFLQNHLPTNRATVPVADPDELHSLGYLSLDDPYLLLVVAKDASVTDADGPKHDSSAPPKRSSDSHPPELS